MALMFRDGVISVDGDFDEQISLDDFPLGNGRWFMDFGGVRAVTSGGIRRLVVNLRSGAFSFVYRRCPPAIIEQFNCLEGLLVRDCTVESFYLPVSESGHMTLMLMRAGLDFTPGTHLGGLSDESLLDQGLEAEVDLDLYLGFISDLKPLGADTQA